MEGIFGRDLELAAMERFFDGAPTWPSAIVIEGEAGIGKTTMESFPTPRSPAW